ncbi:MAG: 50S ribosomal protein L4, partial [Elusimicrobia bacterium]|nr:50S ribosomal protein L4 [Elusimicrobiota bacterium]
SVGTKSLPDPMFGVKAVNPHLVHEVVRAYLANQRKGTHSSLTRSEVTGGGRKPWKQKHTGRARSGSTRSPLWRKGGIIFGPKPRDYSINLPHAKVKSALRQVLSAKAANGEIVIAEKPVLEKCKTKEIAQWIKKLNLPETSLLVVDKRDEKISQASKNLKNFSWIEWNHLHPYHLLQAKKILICPEVLQSL